MSDRLQEIEERLNKITPGKWEWGLYGDNQGLHADKRTGKAILHGFDSDDVFPNRLEDGDFIVHASEDIKWLIEEVKRLRNPKLVIPKEILDALDVPSTDHSPIYPKTTSSMYILHLEKVESSVENEETDDELRGED